jgi:hypothetical protein
MTNTRTILQRMKQTALLAVLAATWSCTAPEASEAPEELAGQCPEGTELVQADGARACQPSIRITACPPGAELAQENARRQRCQRDERARHGASSSWYATARDRVYTEWWEGAKHGKFTLWYENGQIRSEGFHLHGKPAGEWVYYAKDGKVLQRRTFSAAPPPTTWLADAIAGRPPVSEPK